jgi:predicted RNA binding protein YcfA (HicA-like mRNA interferase family)
MKPRKVLESIVGGSRNVRFDDMVGLLKAFGFVQARTSGSHHIFVHPGINELVNLQKVQGEAKPYQVRQFLKLVERYHLTLEDNGP